MKHRLRMIWRILRDKQVVVITEDHGRMYYNWDTLSIYVVNNNDTTYVIKNHKRKD